MKFLSAIIFIAFVTVSYNCSLTRKRPTDFSGHPIILPKNSIQSAGSVLIVTDSGNMVAKLYDSTPLHNSNFLGKVNAGFYDSLMFHRVIKRFMIQGGDPKSKHAKAEQMLGNGEAPGKRIPAEFRPSIYHVKGALAMARDDNSEKASSNCQFYIVQGKIFTPMELDSASKKRHFPLDSTIIKLYTTIGGAPHLDMNYTVFGQVIYGLETIDKIANAPTSATNRPLGDVRMKMYVLDKRGKVLKK